MNFLFSSIFWGSVLIILGLSFIIRIPVFRILFAMILIYIGVKVLIGKPLCKIEKNTAVFSESKFCASSSPNGHNIIFGNGTIDLSNIDIKDNSVTAKVNVVFGAGTIKLNPKIPTEISVNSAFARSKMLDGNIIPFGEYNYKSENFKDNENHLNLQVNVVFGNMELVKN